MQADVPEAPVLSHEHASGTETHADVLPAGTHEAVHGSVAETVSAAVDPDAATRAANLEQAAQAHALNTQASSHVEAPVAATETAPSHTTPMEAPPKVEAPAAQVDVFTNHNNVPVDLREPHAYTSVDTDGSEVLSIVGGKGHDSFFAAQQYVESHPEYFKAHPDAVVRFAATDIDSVTGAVRPYTGGFRIAPDGSASMVVDAELPPPPSAETFAKRLDFTFKKST